MGFFEIVFGKVDVLAVVAFAVATLCITWALKGILRRFPKCGVWLDDDFPKVLLSWAVGAVVFMALHLTLTDFPITQGSILQFIIWVLLLNGGYRIVTTVRDMIRDWRSKGM